MQQLKSFRDDEDRSSEEFTADFLQLPPDILALTAGYRLNQIIGSSVFWQVFQLVMSFTQNACSKMFDEIPLGLKITLKEGKLSRAEIVQEAMKVLTELDEEFNRYHFFLGKLQDIAMLLEERKFAFKDVRKLRTNRTVRTAIKELEAHYKVELEYDSVGTEGAGDNVQTR
ncbi:hypothetical protein [Pseudomonas azerbaijanoccidentalis]